MKGILLCFTVKVCSGSTPTGSWKDRSISLAVSCAKGFGYKTVSVYSCGNAGSSTAAYAAKAGMRSVIFVLPTVDRGMFQLMVSYAGCVVPIQISSRDLWRSSRVGELLEEAQSQLGWFPATTVRNPYVGSPYYTEGFKTIASGLDVMISSDRALEAIKESHGLAESVSDSAIRQAMIEIRQEEGVNASPEGAATWAAIKRMKSESRLKEDDLVVCISSASGLKYSEPKPEEVFPSGSVPLNLTEISDYVNDLSL